MWKWKYEHITATLCDNLHVSRLSVTLLKIRQRITHKLCIIVYNCLHGAAPYYLTELCVLVAASTGYCCFCSAAREDLMVPRTRTITYGSRSFTVSRPRVWNDLPPTLRSSSTILGQFQSRQNTTLFRLA